MSSGKGFGASHGKSFRRHDDSSLNMMSENSFRIKSPVGKTKVQFSLTQDQGEISPDRGFAKQGTYRPPRKGYKMAAMFEHTLRK